MPIFEYAEIEVEMGGPISGTHCFLTLFHSDKDELREGKFGQVMAEMGEKGWELVAASARRQTGLTSNHKINYIFKRAKE